ncbi:MAG: hypothetical protein ACFBSF_07655 [Leptolyngbyaceae cyanobacterium]
MANVKAILKNRDGGKDIQFMFNPKELSFQNNVDTADNPGARSERTGRPKVSFSNIPPKTITIANILFDTFETGKDVVDLYIKAFEEATRFINGKQRPPVYCFLWGKQYLEYCFIEQVNYKLTKFSKTGVPVRAIIDNLTLKETEKPTDDRSSSPATQANPLADNMQTRNQLSL